MNNKRSLLLALSLMASAAHAEGYTMDHVKTAQKATAVLSTIALPLMVIDEHDLAQKCVDATQQCLSRATESDVLLQKLTNIAVVAGKEGLQAYAGIQRAKASLRLAARPDRGAYSSYPATASSSYGYGYEAPRPSAKQANDHYTKARNQCLLNATSKIVAATLEEVANTMICMKLVSKFDNRAIRRIVRAAALAANETVITAADQLICKDRMSDHDEIDAFAKLKTRTGEYFTDLALSLAKNAAMQAIYEVVGELILQSAGDAGTIKWLSHEKEKAGIATATATEPSTVTPGVTELVEAMQSTSTLEQAIA